MFLRAHRIPDVFRAVPCLVLGAAAASGLLGCRSNAIPDSTWPPTDFRIDVFERAARDVRPRFRSFRVWNSGLALYREADRTLEGVPGPVPVYATTALYRLHPNSLRTLARELGRAGLLAPPEVVVENREAIGPDARVSWWAFGDRGSASAQQPDRGPLDRSLRVVDAYLPGDRRFGDAIERVHRLDEVPEPLTDLRGSLAAHLDVVAKTPGDVDLLRETFALAIAAEDWGVAADALQEIESVGPGWRTDEIVDEITWRREEIAPLRAILDAHRPRSAAAGPAPATHPERP